ncbi:hypothetical protein Hanom_Chr01g00003591 [Helianthus anomalus]
MYRDVVSDVACGNDGGSAVPWVAQEKKNIRMISYWHLYCPKLYNHRTTTSCIQSACNTNSINK